MKLTKALLIKSLRDKMEAQGYHYFKDSITGAQGLFAKKIGEDIYLTVGMTIHRYYDDAFTADLYLSKTTTIYCTWGDIPKKCRRRPGELLSPDENIQYGHRGWWSSESSIDDFLQSLRIAELRMCQDRSLLISINKSKEIENLYAIASKIRDNINSFPDVPYSFIPKREIDSIPIDWFKATEFTLKRIGAEVSLGIVKFHASDAYRQNILDKTSAHKSLEEIKRTGV